MMSAQKCECPAATGQNATNKNAHRDFTPDRNATLLIAKLEQAGHRVYKVESGFLVTRWGMSRLCHDSC